MVLLTLARSRGTAGTQAASEQTFPATIRLPDGFQPEGIAIAGNTFYVGSIPTGAVYRGDLRTGAWREPLVPGGAGKAAIGVEVRPRAASSSPAARRGRRSSTRARPGGAGDVPAHDGPTFINDVVVTRNAAWFTDSLNPVLYRVRSAATGRPGPATVCRRFPTRRHRATSPAST